MQNRFWVIVLELVCKVYRHSAQRWDLLVFRPVYFTIFTVVNQLDSKLINLPLYSAITICCGWLKWNLGSAEKTKSEFTTSPKGFSASKCDVGNWIFSKSKEFLRNCLENYWIFLGFFWRIFLEEFFWKNFFGGSFWKEFLGGIFWEDFFWRNSYIC